MQEQEQLKEEIQKEKVAKEHAEEVQAELSTVCLGLRHKALAFAMRESRELRKKEEVRVECEKLASDVTKGTEEINAL